MSDAAGPSAFPQPAPLGRYFALPTRDAMSAEGSLPKGWLVSKNTELPGQRLADGSEKGQGSSKPITLVPGAGVERHGAKLRALRCGYVQLDGKRVSVLNPIWVSKDGLEACFLSLERLPSSTIPKRVELRAALSEAKVRAGVSESTLSTLSESLRRRSASNPLVTLAKGTPAVPPHSPEPRLHFTHKAEAGKVLSDGSIDFKERNAFSFVKNTDLLAERLAPLEGTPGKTVRGEPIDVEDPSPYELTAGSNVRAEEKDGGTLLFAECDGQAMLESKMHGRHVTVTVVKVARIQGDIDFQTGNLEFEGSLIIQGGVHSGFRVKAAGDIAISGTVEDGAEIEAGGDLSVGMGIVGSKTRVRVGGDLVAKFIQDSSVEVDGDAVINGDIFGALVICHGQLRVDARGGSGRGIVGGEIWALRGVRARNVGSRLRSTRVVVGTSPQLDSLHAEAQRLESEAQERLDGLLDSLGLTALDPAGVRELIDKDPSMRKTILFYAAKALKTKRTRDEHAARLREITQRVTRTAARAPFEVSGVVSAPLTVKVGIREVEFVEDLERVQFTLAPIDGRLRVVWRRLGQGQAGAA